MYSNKVGKEVAKELIKLDFITLTAGVVQDLTIKGQNNTAKKIPTSMEVLPESECKDGNYKVLLPNSKEVGIAFFQDLGCESKRIGRRLKKWEGFLKLICWFQTSKTCDNMHTDKSAFEMLREIEGTISLTKLQVTKYTNSIGVVRIYPKHENPFERYDLDESEKQFLIKPYEYFALGLRYCIYENPVVC